MTGLQAGIACRSIWALPPSTSSAMTRPSIIWFWSLSPWRSQSWRRCCARPLAAPCWRSARTSGARFLGIPVDRHIWLSWVISCLFVSLAGTLYALLNNFADPHDLRWDQSGDFVIMAVLGGMRAFWGPLIGAAIFVVLQDYLSSETANWMSFIGLFFVLVVLFFPRGVLGIIQRRAAP